jgi:N-acetylglucosamine-6-phosphate deacetylase
MTVLINARVVTPSAVIEDGVVEITDGRITDVRSQRPTQSPQEVVDLGGAWLLPGYIDLHVHGGGGHDFTRSAGDMAAGVAFHRSRGTTSTLVSLMTAPIDTLVEQLGWVADLADAGDVLGAHLEGPFLSHARCGAQNHEHLLLPDPDAMRKLLEAGRGHIRTVTVAPELPGALALIKQIVTAGAVAAVGHTDATYDETMAAFDAGATLATHLFNAMGSMNQRAPGPSVAALDAGAYVELINDGVHVHEAMTRLATASAPHRLALITDAISATGVGDGSYTLGDREVVVEDGRAHLAGSPRLAGSTLTTDTALRRAVDVTRMNILDASEAASGVPARVLGIGDTLGSIAPGSAADFVVLDGDLRLQRVMRRGSWV